MLLLCFCASDSDMKSWYEKLCFTFLFHIDNKLLLGVCSDDFGIKTTKLNVLNTSTTKQPLFSLVNISRELC